MRLNLIFTMKDFASIPNWIHSHNSLAAAEASILNIFLYDHVDHPIQHKDKVGNVYFRSYKVQQLLTVFILLWMIVVISLFQLCLVLVGTSWWRKISDRYWFLILNFWHELLNIKMTPEESLPGIKSSPDFTDLANGMFCGRSAKIACSCPCIIQRLC